LDKKRFKYRKLKYVMLWMLLLGVPFIIIVPEILDRMLGASYYFVNTAVMLVIVFLIWQLTDILPGIQREGRYD